MPRKKAVVVDETRSIALALKELCEEKGLPRSVVVEAMGEALKKAYFKYSDDYPDTVIKVDVDLETGNISMAKIKNVVAEIEDDVFETDPEEAYEETGIHYNVGDVVETPIDISNFRRAAEMTRIPDERILEIYNCMRPHVSTKEELLAIAEELEEKYDAKINAALVKEAAEVYENRGMLKKF